MKNALIISYYFPPHNGVAGWRPYSWSQHFYKNNIYPTIITRHWDGNENTWNDSMKENNKAVVVEKNERSTVYYLPFSHSRLAKIMNSFFYKIPGFSKVYHLVLLLCGKIMIEIDACYSFKKFLKIHLKDHRYDFVIVSVPPHNLVRLGYYISKKFKIPFIADFRDIWDNNELDIHYQPGLSQRIKNAINQFYMKKWMKGAVFIITVSDSIAKKLRRITDKKVLEITNGFEDELFSGIQQFPSKNVFTISIIGTIYPKQDLSIIIEGLNRFIAVVGSKHIQLNFIGIESIDEITKKIKNSLPADCIYTSPRLSRQSAIDYTLSSHVLLYAGWKHYKGIYSGKIFDYLGAKRNILIAPGDNDVIDNIVIHTRAGKIANSPAEFSAILNQWYAEWKEKGQLHYEGIDELINKHTRANQANLLAGHIANLI